MATALFRYEEKIYFSIVVMEYFLRCRKETFLPRRDIFWLGTVSLTPSSTSPSPPRSSRDRGERGDRERDHGRDGQTQSSNLQSSTSLFTEMMKNKKARELIKQKQQKRSDGSSVIVNSELSDPRSQPQHRQPPQPDGHREVPVGQHPSSHHRHSQVFPPSGANGLPVNKKGPKPPPHRPGALPMPPGKFVCFDFEFSSNSNFVV